MKRRRGKKRHLVTVRVSDQTMRDIERQAAREDRTRSDTVRRLLERSLDCQRDSC